MLKLCLVGPSGSGKSSSAATLRRLFEERGLSVGVQKLARPLYELQDIFYRVASRPLDAGCEIQDQRLLEVIARELRRISPTALVDDLARRLKDCDADVVLNDDLRDDMVDWPFLRRADFVFIRIHAAPEIRHQRLGERGDVSLTGDGSEVERQQSRIRTDFVIPNDKDLATLEGRLSALVNVLLQRSAG